MAKQITEDKIWEARISSANKYYEKWEKLFECEILEKYYEGFQWQDLRDDDHRLYTINKVYETMQIKQDTFIPASPSFFVNPRPGNADYNLELAASSAQLKEDVLNVLFGNDHEQFAEEIGDAYKDSYFRFGIVEVGYSAEWYMNPNAQRPLLNVNKKQQNVGGAKVAQKAEELPMNERIYVKHIPAKDFRVGGLDHKYLDRCGWCGYFEWVSKSDLAALPGLMNRDKIFQAVAYAADSEAVTTDKHDLKNKSAEGDYVKVWKIWDNKARVQLLIMDEPKVTIFQKRFKHFNLFDYRHDRRLRTDGFYPVPPVFHWISPQDEINETREQLRKHRRRFIRKFQVLEGAVDEPEIAKFESGDDGSLIVVKRENAITAIDNPELGNSLDKALVTSSDDLNKISGTGAEARGQADRVTATQANIIEQAGTARDKAEQSRIAKFYRRIGRSILLTAAEKFTLGVWANLTSDPGEQLFGTVSGNQAAFQWVSTDKLNDGYDFRIVVDVTSMTELSLKQSKESFMEFLAMVTQYPAIALSPLLLQEAAYKCGYRNQKVIKQMQQMALLQQASHMAQVQQGQPQGGSQGPVGQTNGAQARVAQSTPPLMEQIRQRLTGQVQ